MFTVCAITPNGDIVIPASNLRLNLDAERAIDEYSFNVYVPVNHYTRFNIYSTPFNPPINFENPFPLIFNCEFPINEGSLQDVFQISNPSLTVDQTVNGRKLTSSLNLIAPGKSFTFNKIGFIISSSGTSRNYFSSTPSNHFRLYLGTTSGTLYIGGYSHSFSIQNTSLYRTFFGWIDLSTKTAEISYINTSGSIVTQNITLNSSVPSSITLTQLTVASNALNFWLLNFKPPVDRLKFFVSVVDQRKKQRRSVYSGIAQKIDYGIMSSRVNCYSFAIALHNANTVRETFINKTVTQIIQELILKYTDLKFVNYASSTPTIPSFVVEGSIYRAIAQLASDHRLTFYTIKDQFILTNSEAVNVGITLQKYEAVQSFQISDINTHNEYTLISTTQTGTNVETFTGNGSNTTFTLKYIPKDTEVRVNGTLQQLQVHYQISGSKIIFRIPPPSGANVEIKYTYDFVISATAKSGLRNSKRSEREIVTNQTYEVMRLMARQRLKSQNRRTFKVDISLRNDLIIGEIVKLNIVDPTFKIKQMINTNSFVESVNSVAMSINGNVIQNIGYQFENQDERKLSWQLINSSSELQWTLPTLSLNKFGLTLIIFVPSSWSTDIEFFRDGNLNLRTTSSGFQIRDGSTVVGSVNWFSNS